MTDLDKLYSPSFWSKRFSSPEEVISYHLNFIENASSKVMKNIQCELNVAYGTSERQKFDIFGTDLAEDAPIFIFIHGGYWQTKEISRASYHFIAENLHKHKIKSIFIGYDLCPDVTMPQIVTQIEVATKKCLEYARNNKSKGVYLMGHSAGAHLASSLFSKDEQFFIKGVILTSGVFDLSPLVKTTINEPLKLDERLAIELSPLKQSFFNSAKTAFYLFVGENESPEFIKQSEKFSLKLKEVGAKVEFAVIANVDHFDIIERIGEEGFEVTRRLLQIIDRK